MLAKSPEALAEEWGIHDYENFCEYSLSGDESIELVHEIALFIKEYQDLAVAALGYFEDLAEAKKMVAENYHGCYESEEAFAEELYDSCYEVPDYLKSYIDYGLIAKDIFMGGYFAMEAPDYKIYVFARG